MRILSPASCVLTLSILCVTADERHAANLAEWSTSATNGWSVASGGPYDQPWVEFDSAVFEGAATNVLVGAGGVNATGLRFDTDGWTLSGTAPVTLSAPATVSVTNGTASLVAPVAGSAGLTKSGPGTLRLPVLHAYTGTNAVSEGVLEALVQTTQRAFGAGELSIAAGAQARLLLDNIAANTLTSVPNPVSGAGTLEIRFAAGTLARNTGITGLSGFTGLVRLSAAGPTGDKWNSTNLGALPASLVIEPGAQLYVAGPFAVGFNGGITVSGTGNSENRGALRINGPTLNGTIDLAGDTTIGPEGGTIAGAIRSGAAGTQVLTLGTADSLGALTLAGPVGGGVGTLALLKTSSSTVTLAAANTYSGGTVVTNGTLGVTNAGGLGSGAATVHPGATLNLVSAGTLTFTTAILGTGRVLVSMSGGIQNTYVPNLSGFTGTLELSGNSSNKLNTSGMVIPAAATIRVNPGAQLFNNGNTTIPATVLLSGTGNGENRGSIRLAAGTVSGPVRLLANASVGPEGGTLSGPISTEVAGVLALTVGTGNSAANTTFSGQLADGVGTLRLVKEREADLVLTRANTYSGGTAVNRGRLVLSVPVATVGAGPVSVAAGAELLAASGVVLTNVFAIAGDGGAGSSQDGQPRGALRLDGATLTAAGSITLTADASLGAYLGTTGTVACPIDDAGARRALSFNKSAQNAPGTLLLSAANTHGGPTRVHNGTVRLDHPEALRASTLNLDAADLGSVAFGVVSSARLGGLAGARPLVLQGPAAAPVTVHTGENGEDTAYSGALSGAGGLVKTGVGTLSLSGSSSHAGGTVVTQGVLRVSGSLTHAARPVDIGPASTLHLDAGTLVASQVLVRANALLTGCGTLTGDLVNEGTVAIDCPAGLAVTGTVTNHGRMRFTGGTALSASGGIVNHGILDFITANPVPPAGLVNLGTVLFADSVLALEAADSSDAFTVSIATQPGHTYLLQRADDLVSPIIWTDLGAAQAGTGATLTFTDPSPGPAGRRYYRFKVDP